MADIDDNVRQWWEDAKDKADDISDEAKAKYNEAKGYAKGRKDQAEQTDLE